MRKIVYAMLGVGAALGAGACGDGGSEQDACDPGAFHCYQDVLQRCADGAWKDYTDCADLGGHCVLVNGESGCLLPSGVFFNTTLPTDMSVPIGTDQVGTGSDAGDTDSGDTGADSGGGGDSDSATTDGERDTGSATDLDTGVVDTDTQNPDTATGVDTASDTGSGGTDSGSGAVDTDTQTATETGVDTASDTGSDATDSDTGAVDTDTQTDTATGVDTASDTGAPGCGNGVVEGTEACDDGNQVPFDGCAPDCTVTHDCPVGAACAPVCGDGVVSPGEGCDDGNRAAGDGCGPDCTAEPGYACDTESVDTVALPAVFRDFSAAHPDFEPDVHGCQDVSVGMVQSTLDPMTGKPVRASQDAGTWCDWLSPADTEDTFAQWYAEENPDRIAGEVVLWRDVDGDYANRYGADGAFWVYYQDVVRCGDVGTGCGLMWCQPSGAQQCFDPCPEGTGVSGSCIAEPVAVPGNPVFFPIDGQGITDEAEYGTAVIPEPFYHGGWAPEPGGALHNFHFTSEIRFVVTYRSGQGQTIELIGDDDIWVFVAGHLVVDLGGTHVPLQGAVDLDAVQSELGLEDGAQYEVAIFHAERKKEGSSLYIGLHNFVFARSRCLPVP